MSNKVWKVVYDGPHTSVIVPSVGEFVRGVPTKVTRKVAESLLQQGSWSEYKQPVQIPADKE